MALLLLGLGSGLQGEIELDFGKAPFYAVASGTLLVVEEVDLRDQLVAGGVGEVVVQVLLT
ncbi:hypothetical protein D3C81_1602600 [compost metagenome]